MWINELELFALENYGFAIEHEIKTDKKAFWNKIHINF
jgi:hypothetical protein